MRILVCPPDFFGVDYVINPWMEGHVGRVDRTLAHAQWSELTEDFARLASVEEITPPVGSPDMCFTANAGLTSFDRVVPTRFQMPTITTATSAWFGSLSHIMRSSPSEVST